MTDLEMIERLRASGCPFLGKVAVRLNQLIGEIEPWQTEGDEIKAKRILRAVARAYEVAPAAVLGTARNAVLVEARHMLFTLAGEVLTEGTARRLGHLFGRDHTTIMHGQRMMKVRLRDPVVRQRWQLAKRQILNLGVDGSK